MATHALKVSSHHLNKVKDQLSRAQVRVKKASERAEEAMETVLKAGVTTATAGALGVLHGRHGEVHVLGVPLELGGGLLLHGAGILFGFGGKAKTYFHSMADAALGVYTYNLGKGVGLNWKATGSLTGKKAGDSVKGLPSDGITDEERAAMQRPIEAQRVAR